MSATFYHCIHQTSRCLCFIRLELHLKTFMKTINKEYLIHLDRCQKERLNIKIQTLVQEFQIAFPACAWCHLGIPSITHNPALVVNKFIYACV